LKITFSGLGRQLQSDQSQLQSLLASVLTRNQQLQGAETSKFEQACAQWTGRKYAVAVGSCTDALIFSLQALGIGAGDEVLVTAFSFVASASAILHVGARPVFVDICADHLMMDEKELTRLRTSRCKAVLAVHLTGQLLPRATMDILRSLDLPVIEDFAQAFGARNEELRGGQLGLISCTSFDPTKILGGFSSGGMAFTDDEDLAEKLRLRRYHGRVENSFATLGGNSQMSELTCAYLRYRLERLNEIIARRQQIAARYKRALENIPELELPCALPGNLHTWQKFLLRSNRRSPLYHFLREQGIETKIQYSKPLHQEPVFACTQSLPVAENVAQECLALPIYPELTDREVDSVCACIQEFLG
jgi:dTDP-4-amino-4,6-dideoxygalactose transaminase